LSDVRVVRVGSVSFIEYKSRINSSSWTYRSPDRSKRCLRLEKSVKVSISVSDSKQLLVYIRGMVSANEMRSNRRIV